jgi:signal transduction histidine kinase
MSCVLFKKTTETIDAASHAQSTLYSELADGLHAMAQPLTIVRGALCALTLHQDLPPASQRYLDMSSAQLDRLCDQMSCLRSLLETAQFNVNCVTVELWQLIGPILEDLDAALRKSEVRIATANPQHSAIHAIADPARTEQALRTALNTAISIASRGDVILLDVLPRDGFIEIAIRNMNPHGKSLGSSDRLSLSLVKASIQSQQGIYECAEDPLRVSLKLPLQETEEMSTSVTSHYSRVNQLN